MRLRGKIDSSSGKKSIYGYLIDLDNKNSTCKAKLVIDGDEYIVDCDIFKSFLEKKYGSSNHGFKFKIPTKYKDSKIHTVEVFDLETSNLIDKKLLPFQNEQHSSKTKPKVSIVVPVYNTSFILEKTISSIINQSFKDIEIILVNDCSTDKSAEIIIKYTNIDKRIKFINHEINLSSSQARKNGVAVASGDYLMFVDGDDELHPDAVRIAYETITKHDVDMVNFGTNVINCGNMEQSRIDLNQRLLEPKLGLIKDDLMKSCFEEKKFAFNLWNKIYKTKICKEAFKLVEDGNFPKAQDLYAFFYISKLSHSYYGIKDRLYNYNFGLGVTGGDSINYERFEKLVSESQVTKALQRYSNSTDNTSEKKIIDKITFNLINECYSKFENQLIIQDKDKGFSLLVDSFGAKDLVSYLTTKFWYQRPTIGQKLKDFSYIKNSKKNIKTIAVYYNTLSNGGAQRVTVQIANLLCNDYKVVIISDDSSRDDPNEYTINSKIVHEYLPNFTDSRAEKYPQRALRWQQIIDKHGIDLLITGFWLSPVTFWDIVTLKLSKVNVIMHSHNTCALPYKIEDQTSFDLLYRYYLCDGVVALSRCDEFFISSFNKNCMTIANPPCDSFNNKKEKGRNKTGLNILWLGRISDEKRPLDAIKMMEKLVKVIPNCHLSMVGKGKESIENSMKELIKEKNLSSNISLEGFTLDVAKYYSQADVFICTSEYEGWPLTLGEAMTHHLPIISYDMPYLEYFSDGRGIIAIPQGNYEMMALKVEQLLKDHDLLNKIGEESYNNIYDKNQEDILGKWKQIINNISTNKVEGTKDFTIEEINRIKSIVFYQITQFQNKVKVSLVNERTNLNKLLKK